MGVCLLNLKTVAQNCKLLSVFWYGCNNYQIPQAWSILELFRGNNDVLAEDKVTLELL
jgi:hypothetical protein